MKNVFFTVLAAVFLISCIAPGEKPEELVFYPPLPQQPRLQFLISISDEEDIGMASGGFREFLLGDVQTMKGIGRPFDINAVKGKIYISDRKLKMIIVIDLEKKEFDYIRAEKQGALIEPEGIWVTEKDVKYIADMGRKQIVVFNSDNKFVRAYGAKEQFVKPTDVAVYEDRIYVCDPGRHQVVVVDKDSGKTIRTIGEHGAEEGRFYNPTHVRVDSDHNIFVNDAFNFRIQKFDSEGNFIIAIGYQGSDMGGFAKPEGFDLDREGHLYVTDVAFENIKIFDSSNGKALLLLGNYGPGPGNLYMPASLYIDYDNVDYFRKYADRNFLVKYLVYVGNMLGENKINVYGFGDWKGAPSPK